jgi:hypothetical protein
MRGPETEGGAVGPDDGAGARRGARRLEPANVPGESGGRPSRGGSLAAWLRWIRSQPVLAAALLGFCLVAVGGLVLSLPRGTLLSGRTSRSAGRVSASDPVTQTPVVPREAPAARGPGLPATGAPSAVPGPWIEMAPSPPSGRGLALVYRYRTLPPGGESRYEWIVQVRGARPVLEGIDVVTWLMEPAAKNDGDLTSRDRAADGFPLFGDGPGGWFGVSARIRYRDGGEETLSRRIELPD